MQLEAHDSVAVLRMQTGKGNSITTDFLHALDRRLGELGDARALVVTGHDGFFSAGISLPSVISRSRDELREFMNLLGRVTLGLFRLPIPTIAALNGHAIAGGCVLAISCDQRIMGEGRGKIGLSEVSLGIGLPAGIVEVLRYRVPSSSLFPIALRGVLSSPHEALELGLVDDVVAAEALEERTIARARELAAIAPAGFAQVKAALIRATVERIERDHPAELERWLDTWFSANAQRALHAAVAKLTGR
jgi:enoyl-CoA hydratase